MAYVIIPSFVETLQGVCRANLCKYSLRLNLLCGEFAVYRVACFEWNFGSNERRALVGRQRTSTALRNEFCKRN